MHTRRILEQFFDQHFGFLHAARARSYCDSVGAVLSGGMLSLCGLARALEAPTFKSATKRMDRLLGSAHIDDEAEQTSQLLLKLLSAWMNPLVLAVDWSAVSPGGAFVELRAAAVIPGAGRGLVVAQVVLPLSELGKVAHERAFLQRLRQSIPQNFSVILLTDAGFRRPWFECVTALGFNFIGRIRRGVKVGRGSLQEDAGVWFEKATPKARRYEKCTLSVCAKMPCDVVLYRRRKRHRQRYRSPGYGGQTRASIESKKSAQEPLMLVHSCHLSHLRADEIVALYERRMQIEENFRDTKSLRFGVGQEYSRSRSASRIRALLVIAMLAHYLLWHIGQVAEAQGMHRRFKVTTRQARELSIITLALLLCKFEVIPFTREAVRMLAIKLKCPMRAFL